MRLSRLCLIAVLTCAGCSVAPKSKAPLKLSVLGLGLEAGEHLRQDALAEYSAKTGIEFDLVPTPGTSTEQLPLVHDLFRRRANTPDVYLIDGTWPGFLHEGLLDLTAFLNDEARRHAKPLLENNTVRNRLVALPLYMNGGALFYRSDLLKKYGYASPPATWTELRQMSLRIQEGERRAGKRAFWGYIWQGGAYEGLTCNAMEWQASFDGGRVVENDGTITVDNAQAEQAMKTAASWVGSISPKSVLAYTESDTFNVFRSGNAAFMRHWGSAFQSVRKAMKADSVAIAPLPAGPAGRAHAIGGFQLAVSRYSLHPKEAAELVLYLTGIEVQTRRALRRGYVPTYPELHRNAELLRSLPQAQILGEAAPETWVFRPASITGQKYPEVSKTYYQSVHGILSGQIPVQRGLAETARKLKLLAENPGGKFQY
jgi:trehalose/maltose transport system substrate-binding protein